MNKTTTGYIVFCSPIDYKNTLTFNEDYYSSGVECYWQIAELKNKDKLLQEFNKLNNSKYSVKNDWEYFLDIILQGYEIQTFGQINLAMKRIITNLIERNGYKPN